MHSNYLPPFDLHISQLMPQSSNCSHVTELGFQDYSAIGQQAMTPIPQFSDYRCNGELKPQAGYLRPEIGWSQQEHFQYHHPPPHYLDMRVITEREIEEERMREEMIQSDIARRHVLEAEARRVLMMEREFIPQRGSNGFPFSSFRTLLFESLMRLPCSVTRVEERWVLVDMIAKLLEERERLNGMCETGRLDTLPFQRGTSYLKVSEVKPAIHEDNQEGRIILLPKPDVNASRSKREAETLDAFMKKKAKVEWSCAVCEFSAFSERHLNEHLSGTKHKNEESKMRRAQKGKNYKIDQATNCKSAAESLACEKKKRRRVRKRSKKQASQLHIVQQNCGAGQSMIPATINSSKIPSGSKKCRIGQATDCESAAESLACEKKKRRRVRTRSKKQASQLHIVQQNCGADQSMIPATESLACEKKKRRRARKRSKKQASQLHIVKQNCGADQSMIPATESLAREKKKSPRARKRSKKQASQLHVVLQNCVADQSMIPATINASEPQQW